MQEDISLFLAIEKMIQESLVLNQGKPVVKDIDLAAIYDVKVSDLRKYPLLV